VLRRDLFVVEQLLGANGQHCARGVHKAAKARQARVVARGDEHFGGEIRAVLIELAHARDGELKHGCLERSEHRRHPNHQREKEHRRAVDVQQPRIAPPHRQHSTRDDARAAEVKHCRAQRNVLASARIAVHHHRPARRDGDGALNAIKLLEEANN